ncbi:Hypothetical predicted protein [Pelobates cultripes]|uniref:Uncharacterized protein n=1 Tax=Pelobates cultripes TaxID=61616 RepID=A0AAD1WKK1_PELCU|nr:Hypothetical predicted protein [Pelobates cultripes]
MAAPIPTKPSPLLGAPNPYRGEEKHMGAMFTRVAPSQRETYHILDKQSQIAFNSLSYRNRDTSVFLHTSSQFTMQDVKRGSVSMLLGSLQDSVTFINVYLPAHNQLSTLEEAAKKTNDM